jgi:acetyl-CoA synthetase
MRRVIASVSNFMDVGDVTTLANPEVVETIRKMVQAEKARRGEIPKDLSKEMMEEIKRFGQNE